MKIPTFIDFPAAKPSDADTMMAISYNEHGDPFVLKMNMRYPRPVPRDDQVLVQIHFTSLNPADYKFRRNDGPGQNILVPKPKIPGGDVAGVVVDVGSNSKFNVGDRVAAFLPLSDHGGDLLQSM
jgi:NADPH:quinone reductase-like Zn-dependent oxidoreductase